MWGITATQALTMAVVGAAVVQNVQAIDARQDAEAQHKKDKADAKRAAQFAETEGEGTGQFGNISLNLSQDIDQDVSTSSKSNLSI